MFSAWEPMTLQCCVGSELLGWITGVLATGMLFWYARIAMRWYESAKMSSDEGRSVWLWLVAIFVVCAGAGYGSWILALFVPRVAVITRITFLAAQNIICPVFWHYASKRRFNTIGRHESIGYDISRAVMQPEEMSDRELAALARKLVVMSFGRQETVA